MAPEPEGQPQRRPVLHREGVQLAALLVLAGLLRLAVLLRIQPDDFLRGGDGAWYLRQGWLIAHQALPHPLTTAGPAYPVFLALGWSFFPSAPEPLDVGGVPIALLFLVRGIQIAVSLLVVWLAYRLARRLGGSHVAAMITAVGLGIGPAFVLEPIYILTEPLFIGLLTAAVWLYVEACRKPNVGRFSLAGALLGLASMTRPVAMLLPLVLAPHLVITQRLQGWRRSLAALLGVFTLTLLPWMIYLGVSTGDPLPEGFSSNLWIGAVGEGRWEGMHVTDRRRMTLGGERDDYLPEALRIIAADPLGWLTLRARNLAAAIVTPHGTSDLGEPSVKAMFAEWLSQGRSLEGLWTVVRPPNFALKLATYAFHFFALVFGGLGVWVSRRRWRETYAPVATIAYLIAVYSVLTVLPRYLFPAEVFIWVLAGIGLTSLWGRRPGAVRQARASSQ